jgi:acetyl esterase/lipase
MVAMVPEDFDDGGPTPGLEGVSARVSGCFSFVPPTDLVRLWNQGSNDAATNREGQVTLRGLGEDFGGNIRPLLRLLFHGIVPDTEEHKALYMAMSPMGHVRKDVPPLLICDGEKDLVIPGQHGRELYEKLRAVGADAVYWISPNAGHRFPSGRGFGQTLDDFIVRALKLEAENQVQNAPPAALP